MGVEEITTENDIRHGDDEVAYWGRRIATLEEHMNCFRRSIAAAHDSMELIHREGVNAQLCLDAAKKRAAEAASSGATP